MVSAPAWEQRKLGEVGSTFTGLSGKSKDDFGHGNAKYVTYLNVLQNPVGSITQLDNIEIDEKQNAVKQGDVFLLLLLKHLMKSACHPSGNMISQIYI